MEWSGMMWSFSSLLPSGQHMSSTSRWESLVTLSLCDPGHHRLNHHQTLRCTCLTESELQRIREEASGPPAVIVFLWKSYWLTTVFNTQTSCCQVDVFDVDVVGCCCCFFTHYRKNKYYFVRFVLPPRRYFEVFDNLPHFDNGSCVCTLFLLTFYYFCEILHLLLLYRQRRSVVVMCSGVCEVVWDCVCVCCWKLEYCCESRWISSLLTQCSVFLLVPLLSEKGKFL